MPFKLKSTDLDKMRKFLPFCIGDNAPEIIEKFAKKCKIVEHRAAKVFWMLEDEMILVEGTYFHPQYKEYVETVVFRGFKPSTNLEEA